MLVGNNLPEGTWEKLKPALVRSTESLRALLGDPDLQARRNPLSMRKHFKTSCYCARSWSEVLANARSLVLSKPSRKRKDLVSTLSTVCNSSRKRLALHETDSRSGLVPIISLAAQQVKRTCFSLQCAVPLALKLNSITVFTSRKHRHPEELLKSESTIIKSFCLIKPLKIVWNSKEKFGITKSAWAKIDLLTSIEGSSTDFC